MLKYRIATALVLIPIVLLCVVYLSPLWFAVLTGLIMLGAMWEWSHCMFTHYKKLYTTLNLALLTLAMAGTLVIVGWLQTPYLLFLLLRLGVLWWLVAFILLLYFPNVDKVWGFYCNRIVIGLFILLPAWAAVVFLKNQPQGTVLIIYLLLLVWTVDSAAYFIGKRWGRQKLAPLVSPKKTVEGLIAALVASICLSLLTSLVLAFNALQTEQLLMITIITTLVSVLGDLTESLFKRLQYIKDSGQLLPGHGGLLDRIDSFAAAAPVFTYLITLIKI